MQTEIETSGGLESPESEPGRRVYKLFQHSNRWHGVAGNQAASFEDRDEAWEWVKDHIQLPTYPALESSNG